MILSLRNNIIISTIKTQIDLQFNNILLGFIEVKKFSVIDTYVGALIFERRVLHND